METSAILLVSGWGGGRGGGTQAKQQLPAFLSITISYSTVSPTVNYTIGSPTVSYTIVSPTVTP